MRNLITNGWARVAAFLSRWQEFVLWLPGLVLLAVIGYVILGAVTALPGNAIQTLAALPVLCAYAGAACAFAWLIKRTYLREIDKGEEQELHDKALRGNEPAKWAILLDRAEWMVLIIVLLYFFRVVR